MKLGAGSVSARRFQIAAALLGLALFFVYGAFQNPGHLDSTDSEARLAVVSAWLDRGEHQVRLRVTPEIFGPVKYTITSALAAWPWVLAGRWLEPTAPGIPSQIRDAQWFVLGHAAMIALICSVLAIFARALGANPTRSLFLGLAAGLTTYLAPYARSAQAEGFAALLLLLTILACWWHAGKPGFLRAVLVGLPLGLLLSTKVELAVCIPAVALHVSWANWRSPAMKSQPPWRGAALSLLGLALGILPGILWIATWNWIRYGHPLRAGYGKIRLEGKTDGAFSTPLLQGLWMSLVSPGKSVWIYAPLLVLSVAGWIRGLGRRGRGMGWLVLGLGVPIFVLYAKWFSPIGGTSVGARFQLVVVPMVLLGLVGLWRGRRRLPHPILAAMVAAALTGFFVQGCMTITSFVWHYEDTMPVGPHSAREEAHLRMMGEWRYFPVAAAFSEVWRGHWDLRWITWGPLSERPYVSPVFAYLLAWAALSSALMIRVCTGQWWPESPFLRLVSGTGTMAALIAGVFAILSAWSQIPWLIAKDRESGMTVWSGPVVGIQRSYLGRSRTMTMGPDQNPNRMEIHGTLRSKGGRYDFRWFTDTPGYLTFGGTIMAQRVDQSTSRTIERFSVEMPKGLMPFSIILSDMNYTRRGLLQLEWGRNGRRPTPIPYTDVLGPRP